MTIEKLDAGYSNLPILLEVLKDKNNTLCIRVYMQYSVVSDHVFAMDAGRKVNPNPSDVIATADTLVGNILSPSDLTTLLDLNEIRVNDIKIRECDETTSCIVLNTKLKELSHKDFGDNTYAWMADYVVYLDKLKESGSWVDHTLLRAHIESSIDSSYYIQPLVDVFAESRINKGTNYNTLFKNSVFSLFDIWIPYKTSSVEDAIIRIYSRKYGIVGLALANANLDNAFTNDYVPFEINGNDTIKTNEFNDYILNLKSIDGAVITENDADVYIEAYSGYLPKSRISTVNGVGKFKVGALGLESGDKIDIKLGFKNLRNLVTKQIIVE